MWYVYALRSRAPDRIYIGVTGDLRRRLAEHGSGKTKTTARFDAFELVYYEACLDKNDALRREKQLKTGFGRGYLQKRLANYMRA